MVARGWIFALFAVEFIYATGSLAQDVFPGASGECGAMLNELPSVSISGWNNKFCRKLRRSGVTYGRFCAKYVKNAPAGIEISFDATLNDFELKRLEAGIFPKGMDVPQLTEDAYPFVSKVKRVKKAKIFIPTSDLNFQGNCCNEDLQLLVRAGVSPESGSGLIYSYAPAGLDDTKTCFKRQGQQPRICMISLTCGSLPCIPEPTPDQPPSSSVTTCKEYSCSIVDEDTPSGVQQSASCTSSSKDLGSPCTLFGLDGTRVGTSIDERAESDCRCDVGDAEVIKCTIPDCDPAEFDCSREFSPGDACFWKGTAHFVEDGICECVSADSDTECAIGLFTNNVALLVTTVVGAPCSHLSKYEGIAYRSPFQCGCAGIPCVYQVPGQLTLQHGVSGEKCALRYGDDISMGILAPVRRREGFCECEPALYEGRSCDYDTCEVDNPSDCRKIGRSETGSRCETSGLDGVLVNDPNSEDCLCRLSRCPCTEKFCMQDARPLDRCADDNGAPGFLLLDGGNECYCATECEFDSITRFSGRPCTNPSGDSGVLLLETDSGTCTCQEFPCPGDTTCYLAASDKCVDVGERCTLYPLDSSGSKSNAPPVFSRGDDGMCVCGPPKSPCNHLYGGDAFVGESCRIDGVSGTIQDVDEWCACVTQCEKFGCTDGNCLVEGAPTTAYCGNEGDSWAFVDATEGKCVCYSTCVYQECQDSGSSVCGGLPSDRRIVAAGLACTDLHGKSGTLVETESGVCTCEVIDECGLAYTSRLSLENGTTTSFLLYAPGNAGDLCYSSGSPGTVELVPSGDGDDCFCKLDEATTCTIFTCTGLECTTKTAMLGDRCSLNGVPGWIVPVPGTFACRCDIECSYPTCTDSGEACQVISAVTHPLEECTGCEEGVVLLDLENGGCSCGDFCGQDEDCFDETVSLCIPLGTFQCPLGEIPRRDGNLCTCEEPCPESGQCYDISGDQCLLLTDLAVTEACDESRGEVAVKNPDNGTCSCEIPCPGEAECIVANHCLSIAILEALSFCDIGNVSRNANGLCECVLCLDAECAVLGVGNSNPGNILSLFA
mmetsp:Transcript_3202/g.4604  ORF Transcript_3202/g.4604 Transcript_3202/m.4604 type:complete len:1059 (-) Transcript_3202:162-3338(-)|eukprot:CAMPEP_0184737944 /NCGR_PEP_ID=MMETSP0315-20130426/698_1 /TAXON_ID=101924 /ORGANISM="Rhodosorus marinus, Strain UTEX LB 2760" /LENGTH=1058 /DNA_ID=CAMNT_0027205419 /DNA_START=173 /DNA_END=3349 /DNA_ORIENTATION=+